MSLDRDGQTIHCDSENCTATVSAPVALRPRLRGHDTSNAANWLFVTRQGVQYHYCPTCAQRQLASVRNDEPRDSRRAP
jgi:hypothetical protein